MNISRSVVAGLVLAMGLAGISAVSVAAPQSAVDRLADALDLGWDRPLGDSLPLSKTTVSRPADDKWTAIRGVIEGVFPIVAAADERARSFFAART